MPDLLAPVLAERLIADIGVALRRHACLGRMDAFQKMRESNAAIARASLLERLAEKLPSLPASAADDLVTYLDFAGAEGSEDWNARAAAFDRLCLHLTSGEG